MFAFTLTFGLMRQGISSCHLVLLLTTQPNKHAAPASVTTPGAHVPVHPVAGSSGSPSGSNPARCHLKLSHNSRLLHQPVESRSLANNGSEPRVPSGQHVFLVGQFSLKAGIGDRLQAHLFLLVM